MAGAWVRIARDWDNKAITEEYEYQLTGVFDNYDYASAGVVISSVPGGYNNKATALASTPDMVAGGAVYLTGTWQSPSYLEFEVVSGNPVNGQFGFLYDFTGQYLVAGDVLGEVMGPTPGLPGRPGRYLITLFINGVYAGTMSGTQDLAADGYEPVTVRAFAGLGEEESVIARVYESTIQYATAYRAAVPNARAYMEVEPVPPGVPSVLVPADGANPVATSTELSWTATGATEYDIYLDVVATPELAVANEPSASYAPVLLPDILYYWQIVARNAVGETAGPVWSFTTEPAAPLPPDAPATPSPSDAATNVEPGTALSWATSARATGYDVYMNDSMSLPSLVAANQPGTAYAPTLVAGELYTWKVVAINAGGTTDGPEWSFEMVPAEPAVPTTPTPSHAATGVSTTATLSWAASARATTYHVFFGTAAFPPLVLADTPDTSYAPTMASGTTYYWKIASRNMYGTTYGPIWSFTTV